MLISVIVLLRLSVHFKKISVLILGNLGFHNVFKTDRASMHHSCEWVVLVVTQAHDIGRGQQTVGVDGSAAVSRSLKTTLLGSFRSRGHIDKCIIPLAVRLRNCASLTGASAALLRKDLIFQELIQMLVIISWLERVAVF